ncbi:argininosuccinate lyase [bacterium]|nr:argininosuccinate lyase [bacterium]
MDLDLDGVIKQDEDIHSCIERLLILELGDLGKKIHTGKSRNDQVITSVRLYLKDHVHQIIELIQELLAALHTIASNHVDIIFPGLTHFQTAQPVVLAHHFLAYFEQFERDLNRFSRVYDVTDVCPLGSGALAGNNYRLDRELVARELGFGEVSRNSMDSVSDRDFILEFLSTCSICMMHLGRLSEELVLWSSPLIDFITIGDEFTTGSSIMPQKKNPDIAELTRGKSGRVLANLVGMHHVIKALPLTYNRDLQEDKEFLFDSVDTIIGALTVMKKMIPTIQFHRDQIAASLKKGYILATDLADYLVKKGVPFRQSHEITGQIVLYAEENHRALEALTLTEFHQFSKMIDTDIYDILTLAASVNGKSSIGGTAQNQVVYQLQRIKERYKW